MDEEQPFRSRRYDRRAHADALISKILEARHRTNPAIAGSDANKDQEALIALQAAGELIEVLAGWAVDHVSGLSMSGQKMLPSQPEDKRSNKGKSHPEYVAYRKIADSHNNELAGQEAYGSAPSSPKIRRLILRNLVFANATGFPPWLRDELYEALDAIEIGLVNPILDSRDLRPSGGVALSLMLEFVVFAQYQAAAYGMSLEEARAEVGSTIGKDGDTLKSWEHRLRKGSLGALKVDSRISQARNGASHVRLAMTEMRSGARDAPGQVAEHVERRYGAAALHRAAAKWREIKGAK